MAKRQFQLTLAQASELRRAYSDCRDGPTRTRYQAVWLYGTGYSVKGIEQITACSRTSLMEWCQRYREAGVEGLVDRRIGGNRAMMTAEQLSELRERLRQYTPANVFGTATQTIHGQFWTVEDLQRAVKQWYGVEYRSRTSYRELFRRCGFSYQRPAKVFKSRRPAQVAEFQEQLEKNCSTSFKMPQRQ